MSKTLGILGVGHLASYVVAGLRKAGDQRPILLSPRNKKHALTLKQEHGCDIAVDNQAVADQCKIILLSVRPAQVEEILSNLKLTTDHLLVSCVAGMSLEHIQVLAGPAEVVLTLPLACSEMGQGVVPLHPDNPIARELLSQLGKLIVFNDQSQFGLASTAACMNGWIYAFLDNLTDWFIAKGLSEAQARELVLHSVQGATALAAAKTDQSLREICDSIATPGTYTRIGLDILEAKEAFSQWGEACEKMNEAFTKAV
ncbi:NAD(P)-binding domain-containing protein [Desulforhopalus singaporensis]|uniref:Pyrroline-5-carboxylate reductase n=1 Tax=Desulforhopalus singaporensis TaxID=91360 RepID=A0A1H0VYU6_9BACT|nr:NAD(P)-binding domain-containing protein [Desulforhopalus singaporensis]SDP83395.1 pyrroline-5-carboxylate reductase [Desulforhopalus singaporensis]